MVSYPNYDSPSSALVKMYLGSQFGADPRGVNPYVASSFYAVDRFASYLKDWKEFYEADPEHVVICDRYVTSTCCTRRQNWIPKKKKNSSWIGNTISNM